MFAITSLKQMAEIADKVKAIARWRRAKALAKEVSECYK